MYGITNITLILSRLAFKYKLYSIIYLYVSISHCSVMFITYVLERLIKCYQINSMISTSNQRFITQDNIVKQDHLMLQKDLLTICMTCIVVIDIRLSRQFTLKRSFCHRHMSLSAFMNGRIMTMVDVCTMKISYLLYHEFNSGFTFGY